MSGALALEACVGSLNSPFMIFLLSHVGWETFHPGSSHLQVMFSLNQLSCLNLLGGI